MSVMKRNLLVLLLLPIILFNYSCKDDDPEYPITYTGSVFSTYSTKVYSVDGEITDLKVIKQYVASLESILDSLRNLEGVKEVSITYFSPVSVQFSINQNDEVLKTMAVTELDKNIVYEDTMTFTAVIPEMVNFDYLKYKPITYEEKSIAGAAGVYTASIYKPCYYASKDGANITMTFSDMYRLEDNFCTYYIGLNNVVNDEIKNVLKNQEVLVVQEYTLTLKPSKN